MSKQSVLSSSVAGSWYPADAAALNAIWENALAALPPAPETPPPDVLVLPHAGYAYSAPVAAAALQRIRAAHFDRIVILAPCHCATFRDQLAAPEAGAVATPYGEIAIDGAGLEKLGRRFPLIRSDRLHRAEHAAQMIYPMLQFALKGKFRILPLIVSGFTSAGEKRAAGALRELLGPGTLLAVSSDFTHYGADFNFEPFTSGQREHTAALDRGAFEQMRPGNAPGFHAYLSRTGATICGEAPLALMLETLPLETRLEMLSYATSSDPDGDFSRFVAYMAIAGRANWPEPGGLFTRAEQIRLLELARRSITARLDRNPAAESSVAAAMERCPERLFQPMGCFVTLTIDSRLRGCIGEIDARRPLCEAVAGRAVDAAFHDPRFRPLSADELERTVIEISALTPSRPVSSPDEIEIGRHGMTIEKNGCFAVFLPQVAPEQGWDLDTTLSQLSLKAGLSAGAWKSGARFTVFEAQVFSEADYRD